MNVLKTTALEIIFSKEIEVDSFLSSFIFEVFFMFCISSGKLRLYASWITLES